MGRRNKDLEILVKLVSQGNFDEAQKQFDRLKSGTAGVANESAASVGRLSALWKSWTSLATTSASKIRVAWLTALGPLSSIIIILQTLKSLFGFIFTAVSRYKDAQDQANKSTRDAQDALGRASRSMDKYAKASTSEDLSSAIKAQERALTDVQKAYEDVTKRTNSRWFDTLALISKAHASLADQVPLLAKAEIELKKEIRAREEARDLAQKQEEAEKKRLKALEEVTRRIEQLTLGETELKIAQLKRQLEEYKKAGISQNDIDRLRALETDRINKEAADKVAEDEAAKAEKIKRIHDDLDQRILELSEDSFDKKQGLLNMEMAAREAQIRKEITDEKALNEALKKLGIEKAKREQAEVKAQVKMKTEAAFKIATDTLEALGIINSMQEGHTKEEARRAKIILALQKAIAIANLWRAEAGKGVLGIATAAAGTAVLVAQFAQQSKAIDQAQQSASAGNSELTVSTPLPDGSRLEETFGGDTSGIGATSSGVGSGVRSAPGGGGGGVTNVINVGGVTLNIPVEQLSLDNVQVVARRLMEIARRGVVEAVQLAVVMKNVGEKNASLAV